MNPEAKFRRRLRLAVSLPVLLLGLLSAALIGLAVHLIALLERPDPTDRLIAGACGTAEALGEMQAGLEGYLAAGRPESLKRYREASSRLGGTLDGLDRLAAGEPEQGHRLAALREQAGRWVEEADAAIARRGRSPARPRGGATAADDPAGASLAAIRGALAAFVEAEVGGRNYRDHAAQARARTFLAAACGAAIFLGILLAYAASRHVEALSGAFAAAAGAAEARTDREEGERLDLLSEVMRHYAIFSLDSEGRITTWNVAAERLLGYRADDVLARHITCLYSPEDVRADRPHHDLDWATREGRAEDERWLTRKGGFRFKARVALVALRDPDGSLSGFTNVVREVDGEAR